MLPPNGTSCVQSTSCCGDSDISWPFCWATRASTAVVIDQAQQEPHPPPESWFSSVLVTMSCSVVLWFAIPLCRGHTTPGGWRVADSRAGTGGA